MGTILKFPGGHKASPLHNERGAVLVVGLLLVSVLSLMAAIFLMLASTERGIAFNSKSEIGAFYAAEAGIQRGVPELRRYANATVLNATTAGVSSATFNSFVTNNDPAGFFVTYACPSGFTPFTRVNNTLATLPLPASDLPTGSGTYSGTIEVKANGNPTKTTSGNTDVYVFPYIYTVTSNGSVPPGSRSVSASGDCTITTTVVTTPGSSPTSVFDSFARYALLTNMQVNKGSQEVWFNNQNCHYSGPVHTNAHFHFAENPSGSFVAGPVTSVSGTAEFYNNGSNINLNANNNGTVDVPIFSGGAVFTRGAAAVPLPAFTTAAAQQSVALYGVEGQPIPSLANGIYVGVNAGNNVIGGIYVDGDATVTPGVSGGNATYTITQGSTTQIITVNRPANSTTVQTVGGGTQSYTGVPNGMIYVDGEITSLSGTLGADEQVTIAANDSIEISNNLTYQNYQANSNPPTSPATPSAAGENNVLGILSWTGDVAISSAIPTGDISIHGIVMAPAGEFCVEHYNSIAAKGTVTLLGGVITDRYGAFHTFSGTTLTHGYRRNFVYDARMGQGMSPPYFPTLSQTITPGTSPVYTVSNALSPGINNRPTWRERS